MGHSQGEYGRPYGPGATDFQSVSGGSGNCTPLCAQDCSRMGPEAEDAVLVVSEFATNAIRHAGTSFEICLQRSSTALLVEVSDNSQAPAEVRTPEDGVPGGQGLVIVGQVAREWGSRLEPHGGKTVWAMLIPNDRGVENHPIR